MQLHTLLLVLLQTVPIDGSLYTYKRLFPKDIRHPRNPFPNSLPRIIQSEPPSNASSTPQHNDLCTRFPYRTTYFTLPLNIPIGLVPLKPSSTAPVNFPL